MPFDNKYQILNTRREPIRVLDSVVEAPRPNWDRRVGRDTPGATRVPFSGELMPMRRQFVGQS